MWLPHHSGCSGNAETQGGRLGETQCLPDQIFWDTVTSSFTLTPLGLIPFYLIFMYFSKCLKYFFSD